MDKACTVVSQRHQFESSLPPSNHSSANANCFFYLIPIFRYLVWIWKLFYCLIGLHNPLSRQLPPLVPFHTDPHFTGIWVAMDLVVNGVFFSWRHVSFLTGTFNTYSTPNVVTSLGMDWWRFSWCDIFAVMVLLLLPLAFVRHNFYWRMKNRLFCSFSFFFGWDGVVSLFRLYIHSGSRWLVLDMRTSIGWLMVDG